jgi:sulfate adenylyltransferase subunit 1 (EFTu-like GTPase family)
MAAKKSLGENRNHLKEIKAKAEEKGRLKGLEEGKIFQGDTITKAVENERARLQKVFDAEIENERENSRWSIAGHLRIIGDLRGNLLVRKNQMNHLRERVEEYRKVMYLFAGFCGVLIGFFLGL